MSGMFSRIGAVLEEVGLKNLKTLELVHQPQKLPDTNLPEYPPKSPKTINARVLCQDQDMILPPIGRRSSSPSKPSGREVPLPSIRQKEHPAQPKLWSDNIIGLVGWWRRVEKEGEKEGVAKEKDIRTEDDRKRKAEAKVSFLKQYYPDTQSSPGGSTQILRHSRLNKILSTDGNDDRVTGNSDRSNIIQKVSSQYYNLSLPKRKTESIHTDEIYSSPSKRPKLSTFTQKLQFWSSKDTLSGGDMAGPIGEPTQKTEGQENWRQDRLKGKVFESIKF